MQDVDKCVSGTCGIWYERYIHLKRRMDGLEGPVLIVGLHASDTRRERPQGALFSRLGPHPSTLLELGFLDNMSRWEDKGAQRPDTSKVSMLCLVRNKLLTVLFLHSYACAFYLNFSGLHY